MSNFTATRDGIKIAVTAVITPAAQIGTDPVLASAASDALMDNRGDADLVFQFGGPDVTVTWDTGVRLPAGSIAPYGKGAATHVAVLGQGATTLVMHLGSGV